MLFGEMTSFGEACDLMSVAFDSGVSLFDTAEMYPVPQRAETSGRSEEFVGRWMKARRREEITIATKIAGPSGQMSWIRGGPVALDAANIKLAVEGSLRRLGTDYIDLMQLHWPDRYVPMFGDVDFDPARCFKVLQHIASK
ncbi:unnamed protein product [Ostreobium quekettii]|uniref:NADP-dependent oxidoreductase domain-containing protein n=1 Tax=Ostreobium quekettii TaxID=121088 RepID=A0A8S1IQB4_9CHLO|nr:unnamed protein product [Ostreobium quekettii]